MGFKTLFLAVIEFQKTSLLGANGGFRIFSQPQVELLQSHSLLSAKPVLVLFLVFRVGSPDGVSGFTSSSFMRTIAKITPGVSDLSPLSAHCSELPSIH